MLFILLLVLLFDLYVCIVLLNRVIKTEKSLNKLFCKVNENKKKLKDLEIDTDRLFSYIDNIYIEIEGL